ncbi:Protein of unknown function (DUF2996) [Synechococcus sp. PCC 7502]|uniref:DUF2996 domain-containing protein n=1 Tax=Synechococcus sp. PCC 7502 TaxID=1173263 RepID=UPI00029FE273|nr:DUF2996 domain-containing protein [Synechococcus sp. PCC 7502]AFY72496.1 Protein of unknown function (DUF2996) [Synechococcus sp. PCC 7502]
MSEEVTTANPVPEAKPKAKVEKVKQPTVEELPFSEFIANHYLPALAKAFANLGITDLNLQLEDLQIKGNWKNQIRQFIIYFAKQDINGQKAFSCWDAGSQPSVIEPFLIDERKATLDLLVFAVVQRLNAQKWLAAN